MSLGWLTEPLQGVALMNENSQSGCFGAALQRQVKLFESKDYGESIAAVRIFVCNKKRIYKALGLKRIA